MTDHLGQSATWKPGDRVRVCGEPHHDGCEGTVHEVRLWGRYPVAVAIDGKPGIYSFHDYELRHV